VRVPLRGWPRKSPATAPLRIGARGGASSSRRSGSAGRAQAAMARRCALHGIVRSRSGELMASPPRVAPSRGARPRGLAGRKITGTFQATARAALHAIPSPRPLPRGGEETEVTGTRRRCPRSAVNAVLSLRPGTGSGAGADHTYPPIHIDAEYTGPTPPADARPKAACRKLIGTRPTSNTSCSRHRSASWKARVLDSWYRPREEGDANQLNSMPRPARAPR